MKLTNSFFDTPRSRNMLEVVEILKILSSPHRLAVLCHLEEKSLCVNELKDMLGISQSSLSQHLSRLKDVGLVSCERDHNRIIYSLCSPEVQQVIALLRELYCKEGNA